VNALGEYDDVSITEQMPGADDETVIDFARSERRLLITEDKDFGQLVFAAAKQNSGVILIRYPAAARSALTAAVLHAWRRVDGSPSNLTVLMAIPQVTGVSIKA